MTTLGAARGDGGFRRERCFRAHSDGRWSCGRGRGSDRARRLQRHRGRHWHWHWHWHAVSVWRWYSDGIGSGRGYAGNRSSDRICHRRSTCSRDGDRRRDGDGRGDGDGGCDGDGRSNGDRRGGSWHWDRDGHSHRSCGVDWRADSNGRTDHDRSCDRDRLASTRSRAVVTLRVVTPPASASATLAKATRGAPAKGARECGFSSSGS
jgi:hypothetical protein